MPHAGKDGGMRDPPAAALPGGLSPPAESTVIASPGGGHSAAGTSPSPQTLPPRRSKPSSSAGPVGDGGTQRETQHPQGYPELRSGLSSCHTTPKSKTGPAYGESRLHGARKAGLAPQSIRGRPEGSRPREHLLPACHRGKLRRSKGTQTGAAPRDGGGAGEQPGGPQMLGTRPSWAGCRAGRGFAGRSREGC